MMFLIMGNSSARMKELAFVNGPLFIVHKSIIGSRFNLFLGSHVGVNILRLAIH